MFCICRNIPGRGVPVCCQLLVALFFTGGFAENQYCARGELRGNGVQQGVGWGWGWGDYWAKDGDHGYIGRTQIHTDLEESVLQTVGLESAAWIK